ncbi:hypothetical protein HKD37_10G028117 [Glycine soja]
MAEGINRNHVAVSQRAMNNIQDWERARVRRLPVAHHPCSGSWQKPCVGMLKCNIDAVVFSLQKHFGIVVETEALALYHANKLEGWPSSRWHERDLFSAVSTWCNLSLLQIQTFRHFEISHVRRLANFVAHSLAQAAKSYASSIVFDYIPSGIHDTVINEMRMI